ncbi:hypothetical protein Y032_0379g321 [Ancylostoma ceylanicum]|uniref:Uncharacterized protein n=2 Tax=Ancylostoma ceylanicum TaxID=53326 RepID=A0A016RT80_9BILA|nr:hypothetical protein Y032_0379g321 [Ancylostoma ceylanicum]
MGSSMAKSRRSDYYDHRCRSKDVGSHFSKEYTEYWKRPNAEKSTNFSMEKNEYSYFSSEDCTPTKNTKRYTTVVSAFR